ncbi:barstar family protein [Actinomadura luteofluorescens]|uniref:barstar family protein n=1 Tax=Actinomadura luteofluorescens TaxID=46163 RepID=UPI003D8BF1B7
MIFAVLQNGARPGRYTLTDSEHGHVWGTCPTVDGLFGNPRRGTYELFDWVPERVELPHWLGSRVWLVPTDDSLDPWLLEDAESARQFPDSLVLTGLDDYHGPPEAYTGPIRVHNGHEWLGSCREFVRIVPDGQAAPPLVLRNLVPSERLRAALNKGTRRALDLGEAVLEIRDDHGVPLAEHVLWPKISTWHGSDLVDLELVAASFTLVPEYARPLWERWFTGPPAAEGAWAGLDTRRRAAWLDLVRERGCRHPDRDRPPGHTYVLDGRHVTDEPGLYLALGEAVNGPGGYFGGCLDALADCLRGNFGYTSPATLLWNDASTARAHLSQGLIPEGRPWDLFTATLEVLAEGGMHVTPA